MAIERWDSGRLFAADADPGVGELEAEVAGSMKGPFLQLPPPEVNSACLGLAGGPALRIMRRS